MSKGIFRVYQDEKDPRDIHFEMIPDAIDSVPEGQQILKDEIEKALTVLKMIFPEGDNKYYPYYRPLLSLAQLGLVGENAQPELASRALESLKYDIVSIEGGKIKNKYLNSLGRNSMMLGGPLLVTAVLLRIIFGYNSEAIRIIESFLFLLSGCMAGVWLSFGVRKIAFKFEELHVLEEDRLEPRIRLIFAGLLSLVFGLLFSTSAVVITVGEVNTSEFTENLQIALLLGLVLGFSENALPSALSKHVSSFIKAPE